MTNFSAAIEEAERAAARDGSIFAGKYLQYSRLKAIIEKDVQRSLLDESQNTNKRHISMSIPEPPPGYEFNPAFEEAAAMISHTADESMQTFRREVSRLLNDVNKEENMQPVAQQSYLKEAERLGDIYIATEKYVNLNYLGLHKILKKHDKNIPNQPVYQFYINYLHKEKWLSGDYTQELVELSELFSKLRGDGSGVKNEDAAQGFIRSTKKYWVKEDVASKVRFTVLQHLPVFRFDDSISADYQLVNSVYLDNCSCELYHGRLDKRPGAQAIRLRWYGTGVPKTVFVERKVHHEDWTGESSTKERFRLPEEKVLPYLRGEYTWDQMKEDMINEGRTQRDIDAVEPLFCAVQKKVHSAILRPTVRTQYQRCAFQIPFDATVRISLDTNLRMYKELPDEENPLWSSDMGLLTPRPMGENAPGTNLSRLSAPRSARQRPTGSNIMNGSELSSESGEDSIEFNAWRRNESERPWKRTELHRFPHCILEVKLSLSEGQTAPEWVTELIDGRDRLGFEVHKFSKFIQGTAVLYPRCVQAVPYWIDDASLMPYMLVCAEPTSENNEEAGAKERTRGAQPPLALTQQPQPQNADLHPLHQQNSQFVNLFSSDDDPTQPRGGFMQALSAVPKLSFFDRLVGAYVPRERSRYMHAMKIEPKSFFANERTFLSWLHMAVTIGSVATALLGFVATADRHEAHAGDVASVEVICMILLPLAVVLCFYSLFIFLWRSQNIAIASSAPMNDRTGPVCLAAIVVLALSAIFIISIRELVVTMHEKKQDMAYLLSCFIDT